jgi:hypothetical protein
MSNDQVERCKKMRGAQWFAVAALTAIALVSMTSNFTDNINNRNARSEVGCICCLYRINTFNRSGHRQLYLER